jgi:hypothetical protein
MLDVDELIRGELELAYPAPSGAPDWGEVLRWLPRRRRRPGRLAAGALALTAAVVGALTLGSPWRTPPSFADRALAAIGSKRYVVAVVQPAVTYGAVVDLVTGKARRQTQRTVYVVDSGTADTIPALSSWTTIDGVTVGSSAAGNLSAEPGLATLVGGYRKALAKGTAELVRGARRDGTRAESDVRRRRRADARGERIGESRSGRGDPADARAAARLGADRVLRLRRRQPPRGARLVAGSAPAERPVRRDRGADARPRARDGRGAPADALTARGRGPTTFTLRACANVR